ncbi:MAG: LytS/YhcK type 5TM receptor domain-containing protein [Pseudomonadota bacterium]
MPWQSFVRGVAVTYQHYFEFGGSMALVAVFVLLFRDLRGVGQSLRVGDIPVGITFGLAALVQMHFPYEPQPGLIIDLRVLPLVLAGAFLDTRGALVALAIGLAGRLSIGGVGTAVGLMAITTAVFGGLFWSRVLAPRLRRRALRFAALVSCSYLTFPLAFFLPAAAQAWFISNAITPFATVYGLLLPLFAFVLENQRDALRRHERQLSEGATDPESGLLRLPAFERQFDVTMAAEAAERPAALLSVTLRVDRWTIAWLREEQRGRLLAVAAARISGALQEPVCAGRSGMFSLLLPLNVDQHFHASELLRSIERLISETPIRLGETLISAQGRLQVIPVGEVEALTATGFAFPEAISHALRSPLAQFSGTVVASRMPRQETPGRAEVDRLFAKANYLMGA